MEFLQYQRKFAITLALTRTPCFPLGCWTDGAIEIWPLKEVQESNFMDSDPELLENAIRAYIDGKFGNYVKDEEIKKLLDK